MAAPAARPPDHPLLEIGRADVDRARLAPSPALIGEIARRIVRHGDPRLPGYAVIPATRHLVETADRARQLQLNIMRALVDHLRATDPGALRPQRYIQLAGRAEAAHYRRATLFVDDRWKIFPGNKTKRQGGSQFHFDDLRTIVASLCYRGKENAIGGTLQFIDLLRFAADRGVAVGDLYSYHRLSLGIGGGYRDDARCPLQLCALVHPQILDAARRYRRPVPLAHADLPLVIFSNRTSDGLVHTASAVRRKDPRAPSARPFTYANIFFADPWQLV